MIRSSWWLVREVGMALAITRQDLSAAELRKSAARSRDASAARRMLAIALVLEGSLPRGGGRELRHGPADAARLGAPLQRRGDGRAGEPPCSGPGATALESSRRRWWPAGWRRDRTWSGTALCAGAAATCRSGSGGEFRVSLHERTVGKLLTKLRFRRLSVRPQHPQSDPAAQAAFRGASLIG